MELGGGLMSAYGFFAAPDPNGVSPWASATSGNLPYAVDNVSQRIGGVALAPVTNSNGNPAFWGELNGTFWGGVGIAVAGWALGKVVPSLRRKGWKIGSRHKVTLA